MRFLFVIRLYSGFENSIANATWAPSGAPTIARLLPGLAARGHEVNVLFTVKGDLSVPIEISRTFYRIAGLNAEIAVLDHVKNRLVPRRIRPYLTEALHTWNTLRRIRQLRPSAVYFDRGNVFAGAIVSRLVPKTPTVLRVMGITPAITLSLKSRRPADRLNRWLWRSPFSVAICTQDGSGGELWLDRLLKSNVPRHVFLNGVDSPRTDSDFVGDKKRPITVLFVGRLEALKGAREFVLGFLKTATRTDEPIRAVIVGTGGLEKELVQMSHGAGLGDIISFLENIPHSEMGRVFANADIYFSLNRQGNLSNANLEAFRHGICCVVPPSDPASGKDIFLDQEFPAETLYRMPGVSADAVDSALTYLLSNPEERKERARQTGARAADLIGTWEHRVEKEVLVLEELGTGHELRCSNDHS